MAVKMQSHMPLIIYHQQWIPGNCHLVNRTSQVQHRGAGTHGHNPAPFQSFQRALFDVFLTVMEAVVVLPKLSPAWPFWDLALGVKQCSDTAPKALLLLMFLRYKFIFQSTAAAS